MNLRKKLIYSLILVFLFAGLLCLRGVSFAAGTLNYSDVDFSKYPGYQSLITNLQNQYPSWTFTFYDTGLSWNEVLAGEYITSGSPINLVPKGDTRYDGAWISPDYGTTLFDTGSWYAASKPAIAYMMDPRNSINSTDIFQFQNLSSTDYSETVLKNMVNNTFLNTLDCIAAIESAAAANNINPYYLVALMLQEQSPSGSVMSAGSGYTVNDVLQYPGVYNVFNIGATNNSSDPSPVLTDNSKDNVILNGLYYAQKKGWTSLALAITGGASSIGTNYISIGQNTMYFQKFNVVSGTLYGHQYQTNVLAAQNQGTTMRSTYSKNGILTSTSTFNFIIPLYTGMPAAAAPRPSCTAAPVLDALDNAVSFDSSLRLDTANNYISSIAAGTNLSALSSLIVPTPGHTVQFQDAGGAVLSDYSALAATGDKVVIGDASGTILYTYTIIIYGDVNGDGKISAGDYVLIKNSIMGTATLSSVQKTASDVNKDGKLSASDYVLIKNNIMQGTPLAT